eukprot:CAMPEP_0176074410 /NCGR_PEP_ID=MMETSP0120_2-20121206/37186_1 /TAXON_ID=160619 /ORGANISM="Kryptoperidinium foliaceum, Strain CCMP 1326" /LENGTH=236 /DNA_ID=CAMNT_0017408105 /DNA_START=96 /DNA_END=806 /DNA_ORIENTATION=+
MSGSRADFFFMAQIAEQAERWDDMREYMSRVANVGQPLEVFERNMLSLAFKESVNARRSALRELRNYVGAAPRVEQYQAKLQAELGEVCSSLIGLLPGLIDMADPSDVEAKVFYMKMRGDYCRYLAEYQVGEGNGIAEAKQAYEQAMELATNGLGGNHPGRLGLALNFSVFQNEVLGDKKAAIQLAKETLEHLSKEAPDPSDPDGAANADIKQILEANLSLWRDGAGDDGTQVEDM